MINKTGLHNDIDYVLLDQETLQRRVHELAENLTNDYRGKNPVFLCILKGSVHFFSDLVRQFDDYCEIDFLAISSYKACKKNFRNSSHQQGSRHEYYRTARHNR